MMKYKFITFVTAIALLIPDFSFACDDTLVMLLTAQNPTSEFSKAIRGFMSSLTVLGTSLKNNINPPFDKEMTNVMKSWLEFSKRYMANPPEEAKNDVHWVEKTNKTAKAVGEIRKFISAKEYTKAHDKVLALSVQIGEFFEAFGVSDEKQLFIRVSSELLTMQRLVLASDFKEAIAGIEETDKVICEFKPILPDTDEAKSVYLSVLGLKDEIFAMIKKLSNPTEIDKKIVELQNKIELLRSQILMQEWFPGIEISNDGEKK